MTITEWNRLFFGSIKRGLDAEGNPEVYCKVKVLDVFICAMASYQWELGDRLDELVLMVLNYGMYEIGEKTSYMSDKTYVVIEAVNCIARVASVELLDVF